jgi:hypothetical protein
MPIKGREFADCVQCWQKGLGGRNKLADQLGVSRPYIGRVLKGEKPMTEELVEKFNEARDTIAQSQASEMSADHIESGRPSTKSEI